MVETTVSEPTVVDALVLIDGASRRLRLNGGQLSGVACVFCDGRHRPLRLVGRLSSGAPVQGCTPSCVVYRPRDIDPVPDGLLRTVKRMFDSVDQRSPVLPESVAAAIRHVSGCDRCRAVVHRIEGSHDRLAARLTHAHTLRDALVAARELETHDRECSARVQRAAS